MRKLISTALFIISLSSIHAQVDVLLGFNVGRNTYLESSQDNLCTQFNLGWKADLTAVSHNITFYPDSSRFQINKPIKWGHYTRGIVLGTQFNANDEFSWEITFNGATKVSEGKRTNSKTGEVEEFKLKTKFGGIQILLQYNPIDRISLFGGMGVNMLKSIFSYSGDTVVKNVRMGESVKISGATKYGDKCATLVFPLGATATLLKVEAYDMSLKLRFTHNIVFNNFLETNFIFFKNYSYNLNNNTLGLILSKTF